MASDGDPLKILARAIARLEGLVDRLPVTQEDHAIGPRGELRVVGHDNRRDPSVTGRQDHAHHGFAVD